jgi:hypothetical protein
MQNIKIQNYSLPSYGTMDYVVRQVGTEVLITTYCLHLTTACENRPQMVLQNNQNHDETKQCPKTGCTMNLHQCENLKSYTKKYKEQVKCGQRFQFVTLFV